MSFKGPDCDTTPSLLVSTIVLSVLIVVIIILLSVIIIIIIALILKNREIQKMKKILNKQGESVEMRETSD